MENNAATKIQKIFRGKRVRSAYKRALVPWKRRMFAKTSMRAIQRQEIDTVMGVHYTIALNTGTGWAAGSTFDLCLGVSQSNLQVYLNGSAFTTKSFANASDYAGIYDVYKINKMQVDMMVDANVGTYSTSSQSIPIIYSVIDYDDYNVLGSVDAALAYASVKAHQFGFISKHSRFVQSPAIQLTAETTGGGSQLAVLKKNQWLNTDFPNVQHLGLKLYYDPISSTGSNTIAYITFNVYVYITYKFQK